MPMSKEDRQWHRQPYDYARQWRARAWGPVEQRHHKHPLRYIFQAGAYSHKMGLAWLKLKGCIGPRYTCVEEIPPLDVHWILDLAQANGKFSMEWVEGLREAYEKSFPEKCLTFLASGCKVHSP